MTDVTIVVKTIDESTAAMGKIAGATKELSQNTGALVPGLEKARMGVMGFMSANAGLITVLAGVGAGMKYAIDQAAEAEKVNAQLEAVLKSTGGAAGMTADELDKMATSLSRMSTYDDEAIKSSEALLLTFTKIGRDVFPEAQQAILDMS